MDRSQTEKVNIFSPELVWAPVLFILRKGGKNVILIEESNIERKPPMRRFLTLSAKQIRTIDTIMQAWKMMLFKHEIFSPDK